MLVLIQRAAANSDCNGDQGQENSGDPDGRSRSAIRISGAGVRQRCGGRGRGRARSDGRGGDHRCGQVVPVADDFVDIFGADGDGSAIYPAIGQDFSGKLLRAEDIRALKSAVSLASSVTVKVPASTTDVAWPSESVVTLMPPGSKPMPFSALS